MGPDREGPGVSPSPQPPDSAFVAPIPTLVVGRFSQLLARGYLVGLGDEEGLLG
jgi:hypothetical protein